MSSLRDTGSGSRRAGDRDEPMTTGTISTDGSISGRAVFLVGLGGMLGPDVAPAGRRSCVNRSGGTIVPETASTDEDEFLRDDGRLVADGADTAAAPGSTRPGT